MKKYRGFYPPNLPTARARIFGACHYVQCFFSDRKFIEEESEKYLAGRVFERCFRSHLEKLATAINERDAERRGINQKFAPRRSVVDVDSLLIRMSGIFIERIFIHASFIH